MNAINRRDLLLGLGAAAITAAVVTPGVSAIAESDISGMRVAKHISESPFEHWYYSGMRVAKIDFQRFTVGYGIPERPPIATIRLINDHYYEAVFTTDREEIITEMQRASMADRTFTIEVERDVNLDIDSWVSLAADDGEDLEFGEHEEDDEEYQWEATAPRGRAGL